MNLKGMIPLLFVRIQGLLTKSDYKAKLNYVAIGTNQPSSSPLVSQSEWGVTWPACALMSVSGGWWYPGATVG